MDREDIMNVLKDKRFQWAVVGVVFLIVLFMSSSIRSSNCGLLVDSTTGEKIPLALDPFYFLRLAETIVANNGTLPEFDVMRYPSEGIEFSAEILPQVSIWMHKVSGIFGDYTLREVFVFSPVVFYIIGLILFFFLAYVLTGSKVGALISSVILAFIPSYLYRTMAGFADHEAIGIAAFFAAMLVFVLGLKYIDKKKDLKIAGLYAFGAAFLSALTVASWGGIAKFVFMIFPLSFLILWLIKNRDGGEFVKRGLVFYSTWIVLSPICGLFFGFNILRNFMLGTEGMISLFVLGLLIIDALLIRYRGRLSFVNQKYRVAYGLGGILVLGSIGLTLMGKSVFVILAEIWLKIFHPWGEGRAGLTVAENAQPYLVDWISQSGTIIFWLFFAGMIFVGFEIARHVKDKKKKFFVVIFWALLVCGSLFSRISASSVMNGTNFISQVVYAGSMLASLIFFAKLYFDEKFELRPELIFVVAWLFFTLLSGRAAQRMFFAIAPFGAFMVGFLIIKLWEYFKSSRDEVVKIILIALLVVSVLGGAYEVNGFRSIISAQAAGTGPSAHYQWQGAMSWVRENTYEDTIFVHWWDYGYWVEYLGERATLTDGGHAVGQWDHFIGRYLLTTPRPETAYSFMKTHNVSYLLIDPTDLGKYPAYSRIGSGEDGNDRYAAIPVMPVDASQTRETANGTIMVYAGGMFVDEDIVYKEGNKTVFLPANKAAIGGVILKSVNGNGSTGFEQPIGVYFYNNQRYDIPMRYVQTAEGLMDFREGLDAVVKVIPSFDGKSINMFGAAIYLSPKVSKGLFAQLYLMDDAFGNYEYISVAHVEKDALIRNIEGQGGFVGDFIYYGGFRGPIKIWEVGYPENTLERVEFFNHTGEWAEFDDLEFVK